MLDLILTIIITLMGLLSIGVFSPQDLTKESADIKKKLRERVKMIKQEKHGESFYLFDAETDMFLAQGKTDEEIKKALRVRFPKHVFLLNEEYMMAGPDFEVVKIDYSVLNSLDIK